MSRKSAAYWFDRALALETERDALRAQNAELTKLARAVAGYVSHRPTCDALRNWEADCDCGLKPLRSAALAATEEVGSNAE